MKLVISTQIRENYGAHDWDGKGTCPQYWKSKGGTVFVMPDLTPAQAVKIHALGIPNLKPLIEQKTDGFEEFVADFGMHDDGDTVTDVWETPWTLSFTDGRWVASRTVENDEYGCMNSAVARKHEQYFLALGGVTESYKVDYTMTNGDVVPGEDASVYLAKLFQKVA